MSAEQPSEVVLLGPGAPRASACCEHWVLQINRVHFSVCWVSFLWSVPPNDSPPLLDTSLEWDQTHPYPGGILCSSGEGVKPRVMSKGKQPNIVGIVSLMPAAPRVFQVPSTDESEQENACSSLLQLSPHTSPASPALTLGVPRSCISLALQL